MAIKVGNCNGKVAREKALKRQGEVEAAGDSLHCHWPIISIAAGTTLQLTNQCLLRTLQLEFKPYQCGTYMDIMT